MVKYVGKRSQKKKGTYIEALPDPTKLLMWKALRKRLAEPVGGREACVRVDPEFGVTPYTRDFGVELNPNVKAQNDEFASCAKLMDSVFENVKIKYKVPSSTGSQTKYARHTMVIIDGKKYFATREAIRYAMSLCRIGKATTKDDLINELKSLMSSGKLTMYTEDQIKEKYPNAEIVSISATATS